MQRLLERRPLLPAERQAQPVTVCVTGQCGCKGVAGSERLGLGSLPPDAVAAAAACLLASFMVTTCCPPNLTGGAGFIGSRIVARLLAAGHTVHATRRAAGDDAPTIAALQVGWLLGATPQPTQPVSSCWHT